MTKKKTNVDWNDANIAIIRRMWGNGFSASQIAEIIPGATRNSIIGKAHRLGLHRNNHIDTIIHRKDLRAMDEAKKADIVKEIKSELVENNVVPFKNKPKKGRYGPVNFANLRADHCRWPLWPSADKEKKYCGCKVWKGKYCEEHYKLGHQVIIFRVTKKILAAE